MGHGPRQRMGLNLDRSASRFALVLLGIVQVTFLHQMFRKIWLQHHRCGSHWSCKAATAASSQPASNRFRSIHRSSMSGDDFQSMPSTIALTHPKKILWHAPSPIQWLDSALFHHLQQLHRLGDFLCFAGSTSAAAAPPQTSGIAVVLLAMTEHPKRRLQQSARKPFKPRHENQPLGTAHDFRQFFATQTTGIVHTLRLRLFRGPHPRTHDQQLMLTSAGPVQPKRLEQALQVFLGCRLPEENGGARS